MRRFTPNEEAELRGFFNTEIPRFAERIQPVYEQLGWYWVPVGGIPNIDDIEDCLRRLVDSLFSSYYKDNAPVDEFSTSTCGLRVSFDYYDNMITGYISFEDSKEYYLERTNDGTGRSEEDSSSGSGGNVLAGPGS